ncbi:MAG: hypothetical protein K0S53_542 [Bacteroidetes bacterium]|jgi:hypothetical protein|nr:hypothetical protein [Bacteroidota bacterium]MDF2453938.1 hypothetical protein [Bacteroidota bacterium]
MVEALTVIELEYACIQLLANKIVKVEMFDDVIIGLNECRGINNAIGQLSGGTEVPVLMVPGYHTHFLPESRDFSASEEGQKYTMGDALVVSNLGQRILMQFYLKFNKPPKPSKAFDTEAHAVEWLLTLNQQKSLTN